METVRRRRRRRRLKRTSQTHTSNGNKVVVRNRKRACRERMHQLW
jgi:hypothetical protein